MFWLKRYFFILLTNKLHISAEYYVVVYILMPRGKVYVEVRQVYHISGLNEKNIFKKMGHFVMVNILATPVCNFQCEFIVLLSFGFWFRHVFFHRLKLKVRHFFFPPQQTEVRSRLLVPIIGTY